MIDRNGNPITDPSRIRKASSTPLADKAALSLVAAYGGPLSSPMGVDVEGMGDAEYQKTPVNNGHFMIVVDPAQFGNAGISAPGR